MTVKVFAVFMAAKFVVSMSGVDGGFATTPVEEKTETEVTMVVGTSNGKETSGSDEGE